MMYTLRVCRARKTLRILIHTIVIISVSMFTMVSTSLVADTFSDRRVHVGLKLFRMLIAADLEQQDKLDHNGKFLVHLIYANDSFSAQKMQSSLADDFSTLKNLSTNITTVPLDTQLRSNTPPAAIFITQQLNQHELLQLLTYCKQHRILLFSPFAGDVEKGVLAGVSVEATIKPLLNQTTLNTSNFKINDFYVRTAKLYE